VPNFVTGAGGFLCALVYGWPRLRLHDDRLTLQASPLLLPPRVSQLVLRGVAYLGSRLDIALDAGGGRLRVRMAGAAAAPASATAAAAGRMRPLHSRALAAMVDADEAAAAAPDSASDDGGRGAPPAMRLRAAQARLRGAGTPAASIAPGDPRDPLASVADVLHARPWLSAVPQRRRTVRRRALVVVDASGALLGRLQDDGDALDVDLQSCAILDAADFRATV
jgi:hypothetical protein